MEELQLLLFPPREDIDQEMYLHLKRGKEKKNNKERVDSLATAGATDGWSEGKGRLERCSAPKDICGENLAMQVTSFTDWAIVCKSSHLVIGSVTSL